MNPIETAKAVLAVLDASKQVGAVNDCVIFNGGEIKQVREMLALYSVHRLQAKNDRDKAEEQAQDKFDAAIMPYKQKYYADKRSLQQVRNQKVEQAKQTRDFAVEAAREVYAIAVYESKGEDDTLIMPAVDKFDAVVKKVVAKRDLDIAKASQEYSLAIKRSKEQFDADTKEAKRIYDLEMRAVQEKFQLAFATRTYLWRQYQDICTAVLAISEPLLEQIEHDKLQQIQISTESLKNKGCSGGNAFSNQEIVKTRNKLWQLYQETALNVLSGLKFLVEQKTASGLPTVS